MITSCNFNYKKELKRTPVNILYIQYKIIIIICLWVIIMCLCMCLLKASSLLNVCIPVKRAFTIKFE